MSQAAAQNDGLRDREPLRVPSVIRRHGVIAACLAYARLCMFVVIHASMTRVVTWFMLVETKYSVKCIQSDVACLPIDVGTSRRAQTTGRVVRQLEYGHETILCA